MKNIFRLLKTGLVLSILAFSFAACSEDFMDEINTDKDSAKDVTAKFIIPDLVLRTSQDIIGGDFNTYFGSYVEYWTGTHNQLFQAEGRNAEVRVASTFNNGWGDIFYLIRNAKIAIEKADAELGAEAKQVGAIARVMLAYDLAEATDFFGDVPYTDVGDPYNTPYPSADSQQSIYTEIFKLLDAAEATFAAAPGSAGAYDFVYGGNNDLWLEFISGLKARYTMRLLNRSGSKNADLQKVIDYVDASFADASEQASMKYEGTDNQNPLFDFEWSRDGISSGTSMYLKLAEREDPRADRAYWHSGAWVHLDGADAYEGGYLAPTGEPEESQYAYMYDVHVFAEKAPVHFLSYHELLFLKAEAQVRLGLTAAAKATLKEALKAAFANFERNLKYAMNTPTVGAYGGIEYMEPLTVAESDAAAEEYFDNSVAALFDADPLKEVMVQKYIALWGANGETAETFADIRRLKAEGKGDIYGLINPGKFPLRCPYGADDVTTNPNIAAIYTDAGNYIFTENVWWAGGNR